MTVWFSADLHIGHRNIIKYCDRPFSDVDEMDQSLVERWNDAVHHRDIVYILGDMALGKLDDSLAMVNMMHGQKVLVVGNHDQPFRKASAEKRKRMERRYIEAAGLAGVLHGTVPIEVAGIPVLAGHFPYLDEGDQRYVEHRPRDDGRTWLLHGHVHERWKIRPEERMVNVGVDVWDFRPVSEDVIKNIITKRTMV